MPIVKTIDENGPEAVEAVFEAVNGDDTDFLHSTEQSYFSWEK